MLAAAVRQRFGQTKTLSDKESALVADDSSCEEGSYDPANSSDLSGDESLLDADDRFPLLPPEDVDVLALSQILMSSLEERQIYGTSDTGRSAGRWSPTRWYTHTRLPNPYLKPRETRRLIVSFFSEMTYPKDTQ